MRKSIYILIISIVLFPLFSCSKPNSTLEAPVIRLDNNLISWDEIEGATTYKVFVGVKAYIVDTNYYELKITEDGTYEVCVKALSDSAISLESNRLLYKYKSNKIEKLDAPRIELTDDLIAWDAINQATSYEIYVDGELKTTVNSCQYSLNDYQDGNYKIKVVAVNNEIRSIESNEINYQKLINYEKLDAPTIICNKTTVSWSKVNNADRYFVYLDYEIVGITTELNYQVEANYGKHHVQVKAVSNMDGYLASEKSNKLEIDVPIQDYPLDFTKPVSMFTVSSNKSPKINDEGMMVIGDKITKDSSLAFMLIKEGNYYRIKLSNGLYLTHKKNSENMDRFYALPKISDNSQIFDIEKCGTNDFVYKITPMNNPGYLLCEDGVSLYHQYMEIKENGETSPLQQFMIFNVNATIEEDIISPSEKIDDCDLSKPLVMFIKGSGRTFSFDSNGRMIKAEDVNSLTDYSNYTVSIIKSGDFYKIKLVDESYLSYCKKDGKDYFYKSNELTDGSQLFKIYLDNGIYKIEPKNNLGYLLCEDDSDGYHQYMDCNNERQYWIMFNVEQ